MQAFKVSESIFRPMSSTIHLLPDLVINQIAAGEVIERPASVVKELVENALDAGATSIIVNLENGGKTTIRVADDGHGMREVDALKCPLRHATSKLRTVHDLISVRTAGFRGEAVASIASIAKLTMETRHAEEEIGIRLQMQGGEIIAKQPLVRPPGTTFLVEDIFYNTPVRRTFLSSENAETLRVCDVFQRLALAHPEVRMELRQGSRELFVGIAGTLRSRLGEVLGHNLSRYMESVDFEENGIRVWGFTSNLRLEKGLRNHQFFYLFDRPISSPMLAKAITKAYEAHGFTGYPVCCLFLELAPGQYDVNVHPAKREVRFASESTVFTVVNRAIKLTLEAHSPSPIVQLSSWHEPAAIQPPLHVPDELSAPANSASPPPQTSINKFSWKNPPRENMVAQDLFSIPEAAKVVHFPLDKVLGAQSKNVPTAVPITPHLVRYYQLAKTYLICEDNDHMIMIDQAAAHQRIIYEEALALLDSGQMGESQEMLFPEVLDVGRQNSMLLEEAAPVLERLGFHLEIFGPESWQLRGIPLHLGVERARSALQSIIENLQSEKKHEKLPSEIIARAWCLGTTIRKGDELHQEQMAGLLDRLFSCKEPFSSPFGRPTLLKFPLEEIHRKFGRN